MNKIDVIMREVRGKIITRTELDSLAAKYRFHALGLRKLLLNKGYLLTIFRGIYYVKSYEEKRFNTLAYSPHELLARGLEIKGVKWYFGLYSALKFLNLTHEVFPVNIVINNRFNRPRPMSIAGSRFFFIKLKPSLFFGLKKMVTDHATLYYSNIEKTLLDFLYLKRAINVNEYHFNKSLFLSGAGKYPRVVKKRVQEITQ